MTLLVVLGVVVIATILAALYLSLKSGRGNEPTSDDAGAGDRLVRGGSRSGRSASLAGRMRSVADRGKAARPSRRRSGDDDDYEVPDYVTARRAARSARGGDRSSLVTTGTGQRTADGRPAAGFDDTDAAPHTGYGQSAAGYDEYDGYDAAADTRVSGPMTGPMTGPMSSERSERPRGYRDRAGERGRDADSSRGRYPGSAREGTGGENFPPADRYSPASFPGDRRDTEPGERVAGPGGYGAGPGSVDPMGPAGAMGPGGGDFGRPAAGGFPGPAAGDFGGPAAGGFPGPATGDFAGPATGDFGGPAGRGPRGHGGHGAHGGRRAART